MNDLPRRIEEARRRAHLTQEALGECTHRSGKTISDYETGESQPPVDVLCAISDATGVPICELLGRPCRRALDLDDLRQRIEAAEIPRAKGVQVSILLDGDGDDLCQSSGAAGL